MKSKQKAEYPNPLTCSIGSILLSISLSLLITQHSFGQNYWKDLFNSSSGADPGQLGIESSSLYNFKVDRPLIGLAVKYGLADDYTRFFKRRVKSIFHVRAGFYFPQTKQTDGLILAFTSNPALSNPIVVPYQFEQRVSYFMFDARTDYYFFTSKQERMALYSGWIFGINFPLYSGKYTFSSFDTLNYTLDSQANSMRDFREGKVNFNLGLNFGADVYVGAFGANFIEMSCLVNVQSEKYLPADFTLNNRFFVGLNLGYRYEL